MAKTVRINTRLSKDMMSRLDAVVIDANTGNLSDHIRAAISEYITRHEPAPQAPAPAPQHPVS